MLPPGKKSIVVHTVGTLSARDFYEQHSMVVRRRSLVPDATHVLFNLGDGPAPHVPAVISATELELKHPVMAEMVLSGDMLTRQRGIAALHALHLIGERALGDKISVYELTSVRDPRTQSLELPLRPEALKVWETCTRGTADVSNNIANGLMQGNRR